MALPDDYLRYPERHYGMDHKRYDWSILDRRAPVTWPGGAKLALWVVPMLEWFPLDMTNKPFAVPGGIARPHPDYWNYTLRDYGNRVGVFRLFKVLDGLGVKATVAMNAALAERHPLLVSQVIERDWELMAYGLDMGHLHYGGQDEAEEAALVQQSVDILRAASGQPVTGWLSPARSESLATPDLLAANGIRYVCDWANDELPYAVHTTSDDIHAMPHAFEIDDQQIMVTLGQSETEYVQQVKDQFDWLYKEAGERGGRVLSLGLHPWVSGQPYRIKAIAEALGYIMGHDGVWSATGTEILEAFTKQG